MKKTAVYCLISLLYLSSGGCQTEEKVLTVGYVPGPFFHYGQTTLEESRHFNLGDIPSDARILEGTVIFSNPGKEPLIINKVEEVSSGFLGWEGDHRLDPEQQGKITVLFDRAQCE